MLSTLRLASLAPPSAETNMKVGDVSPSLLGFCTQGPLTVHDQTNPAAEPRQEICTCDWKVSRFTPTECVSVCPLKMWF